MAKRDGRGPYEERVIDAGKHLRSLDGVSLHDTELVVGERTVLAEDGVGNRYFSDVVQHRDAAELLCGKLRVAELLGDDLGIGSDAAHVRARFDMAQIPRATKVFGHLPRQEFEQRSSFGEGRFEPLVLLSRSAPLPPAQERAVDVRLEQRCVHGLLDVTGRTVAERPALVLVIAVGRQHQHFDVVFVRREHLQEIEPVRVRKPDIEQHDVRVSLGERARCLRNGARFVDVQPVAFEDPPNRISHERVVVDDEDPPRIEHRKVRRLAFADGERRHLPLDTTVQGKP